PGAQPRALEDVAEQLVDLPAHALEVGEKVPLARHEGKVTRAPPCVSDRVDRALARDLDAPAEGVLGLRAGPQAVELVGDVGEHEAPRRRRLAVLAGLPRREVAALARSLRPRERALDQEQLRALRELDEIDRRPAVGAERELAA